MDDLLISIIVQKKQQQEILIFYNILFKIKKYKQNINTKMQAKKKIMPPKKNVIKKKTIKISNEQSDTINTTKQKTFATIQQTFQFQDHKTSTRTTHYSSRRDCLDKMEALKLSPFSSPGKSISPRQRKSFSPIVVKQKQLKKNKKNLGLDPTRLNKKSNTSSSKNTKSLKQKIKNTQKVKAQFENQFLKRMYKIQQFNEKKITELSEQEMEASIKKINKPTFAAKKQVIIKQKKTKKQMVREMHLKIKERYAKYFPNLKSQELRLLCAVILMQRLWRQKKVKLMIGEFLSPRHKIYNQSYNHTFGKVQDNFFKEQLNIISLENDVIQETMKTEKSFPSLSPRSLKVKEDDSNYEQKVQLCSFQNESLIVTPQKSSINLKDLEVSDQLSEVSSSSKAKQILKYIDMYRQVTLKMKKDKKKKKSLKPNAFNFPQSLSQKCLLQNLYKKRVKNIKYIKQKSVSNDQQIDIFLPSKNIEKSKQQYISPKKPQIVELEQRFYTEAQDEQYSSMGKCEKQQIKLEQQTVGSIGNVASKIIEYLINQFSSQFQAFSSKKCLKKKKRLPGIQISDNSINTYLNQFVNYIQSQYQNHFQQAFTKLGPKNFLKIFRVIPQQDIFQPGEDEEQQDMNYPALPHTAFFQYQPIYEQKIFTIKEEQKKYSNFLSGLIKIHNKCLVDCFSEFIEKQRIESIQFPWDSAGPAKTQDKISDQVNKKMDLRILQTKNRIIKISNTRLGKLYRKDLEIEEINLLKSIKEDYKKQGRDWNIQQDLLEIRLELTQLISQQLIQEMTNQMMKIQQNE